MKTTFTNQKKVEENFSSIFRNKGIFSAVGEKTINNYKSKFVEGQDNQPNLHYFAVGHTFKNIDTKSLFDYQLTDDEKDTVPSKYLSLQQSAFKFGFKNESDKTVRNDNLYAILYNIRNINAHFVHDFELIKIDNIKPRVLNFIYESFEIALIKGIFAKNYGDRKKKLKVDFLSNEDKNNILTEILINKEREIIQFVKEIFYQTLYTKKESEWGRNEDYCRQKKQFLDSYLMSKKDWIDFILFNEVEEDIEWELNPKGDNTANNHRHKVLDIKKGKYLSFEGMLFIMTMFLYANEANYLIPKLRGFKKNGTPQDTSKLEVFRFFAKRFKSQDIDSEHNRLVRFRDMVQYLGKFPVKWNNELHKSVYYVDNLKKNIIEIEIKKYYGDDATDEFITYAKHELWGEKCNEKDLLDKFKRINEIQKEEYYTLICQNPKYTDNLIKLNEIKKNKLELEKKGILNLSNDDRIKLINYPESINRLTEENEKIQEKGEQFINSNTEKLKQRIKDNLLFISNGRNNDRFMDFAIRYLAEVNYFGKDAKFKMYENYYAEEEAKSLEQKEKELTKKEFDKLHYHGGKLTHFETYENHLKKHPDWDTPFVVQNNAVYIKVEGLNYQKNASFCIQRDLLNYLLEHALEQENPENKGKDLLLEYYKVKNEDFLNGLKILKDNEVVNKEVDIHKKRKLKKLFPKRLLHHYSPANSINEIESTFKRFFDQAKEDEKRYEEQKKMAIADNRLDLFLNKNKGKQFKLKFIFKAWQLMFFREQYHLNKEGLAVLEKQNETKNNEHEYGHHKKLNITRNEYNLFSKWLYAMDEVPQYKKQLENLLNSKGVLSNPILKRLFEKSNNIEQMFNGTIEVFEKWIDDKETHNNKDRFKLENYTKMMKVGNIHINLSHFLGYTVKNNIVKKEGKNIIRPITKNAQYLYQPLYNIDIKHKDATNVEINLFRKLYKNRLEDCLLYEIALRYFNEDKTIRSKAYNHLSKLLVQDITIPINNAKFLDNQNNEKTGSYKIIVPFKDLEKFAQIQYLEKKRIIKKLPIYLKKVNDNQEQVAQLKDMIKKFNSNQSITLAHFSMLNNHLITQQGRFTYCIMSMEEYFIWKHKLKIGNQSKNRIVISEIPILKDFFENNDDKYESRNSAFHMDLPIKETYKSSFLAKEKRFVDSEIKAKNINKLDDCNYMLKKTLLDFKDQMHDEIKIRKDNRMTEEQKSQNRKDAENTFFNNLMK